MTGGGGMVGVAVLWVGEGGERALASGHARRVKRTEYGLELILRTGDVDVWNCVAAVTARVVVFAESEICLWPLIRGWGPSVSN